MTISDLAASLNFGECTCAETSQLIESQIVSDKYFRRMDMAVKFAAARAFIRNKDDWASDYRTLYEAIGTEYQARRGRLVELLESNWIDTHKHPIIIGADSSIWDGSHRLAVSVLRQYETVCVKKINRRMRQAFGPKVMRRIFSNNELVEIAESQCVMFHQCGITDKDLEWHRRSVLT
jgi:hypothetical protein